MNKLIVIIFLSWIGLGWATNYYVDKNATGANNGTSWANAWQSFGDIDWGSVDPGEIVFISGGTDSTVYNESLDINTDGTLANPVIVRKSWEAGHNGKVVIQGTSWASGEHGIDLLYRSYIKVVGLDVRLWRRGIYSAGTNGIWVDSCNVNKCRSGFTVSLQGAASDSVFVSYCRIISDSTTADQTDALGGSEMTNLVVRYTYIYQGNRYSKSGHSDIMQNRIAGRQLYHNNWFESVASGTDSSAAAGLNGQINLSADTTLMYNNVFITRGWSYTCYFDQGNTGHTWIMYNNTFIKEYEYGPAGVINTEQVETFAKNNIFMSTSDYGVMAIGSIAPNEHQFDYNLYYGPNASGYFGFSQPHSFSWWQSQGGDPNSPDPADPLFTNYHAQLPDYNVPTDLDLTLQEGSPAIDAGDASVRAFIESWGLTWTDYNGVARSETTPSIGAFEYAFRGPDVTPPEVTGATLLDSVTLKIMFSELLDETTAEDENNYSISNNIECFNASLSGSEVTLQTTAHSPGSYIVTVVNVEDLAGNPIAQSNTAEYSLIPQLFFLPIEDVQGVIQEPGHTPLKTIDGLGALSGDPDSYWAANPMPEELIFDLGTNRTVGKTKLQFYNWNGGRVYTYSILISSDNNNWVTIVSQTTSAINEEWTIDEFPTVDARYVKVVFINNNQTNYAGLWECEIWGIPSIVTVEDPINSGLPTEFSLYQNYPNPFNPTTTIRYSIPLEGLVTLKVYNTLGEEVIILANEVKQVGIYEVEFDASKLTSGIYFYKLRASDFVQVKKMILLK